LFASFDVSKKAFHAGAQKRKAVGVVVLLADDDEPGIRVAFQEIGQERAGGRLGGVSVDDIDLRARRLESLG